MSDYSGSIILTTTNSKNNAEIIANNLIDSKLAACVQIDKIKSLYIYQGKKMQENEYRLMIKSIEKDFTIIESAIKKIHNYDLPEIIQLNISKMSAEYYNFLNESLQN